MHYLKDPASKPNMSHKISQDESVPARFLQDLCKGSMFP